MPRLTPLVIRCASRVSPHLPLLLRVCRDLTSAKNELRWLREFAAEQQPHGLLRRPLKPAPVLKKAPSARQQRARQYGTLLESYVRRRARDEPLQYILGTQPFGDLDILCRPNVLIPRPETETYTTEVARLIRGLQYVDDQESLTIADFCSGSGCISLLLHSILSPPHRPHRKPRPLQIRGFDVSTHALRLARDNVQHNIKLNVLHQDALQEVQFNALDLLALAQQPRQIILDRLCNKDDNKNGSPAACTQQSFDIIISNPPYISPHDFKPGGQTSKSVRKYEPELALVPPPTLMFEQVNRADQFYAALIHIASAIRPKLVVMEVGDTQQAIRVRDLCRSALQEKFESDRATHQEGWPRIEIWRDDGSVIDACQTPSEEQAHRAVDRSASIDAQDDADADVDVRAVADADVDCRAVVLWLDPAWIQHRQQNLSRSKPNYLGTRG